MATSYKTPGVYVEEISKFPPSVAEVETAIPAFIGYTYMAKKVTDDDLLNVPTRITSLLEYKQYFGSGPSYSDIAVNLDSNNIPDDSTTTVNDSKFLLYDSIQLFYDNGGGACYIVSVGNYDDTMALGDVTSGFKGGLEQLKKYDEPTLILFPDAVFLDADKLGSLQQATLAQCALLGDRFAILDIKDSATGNTLTTDVDTFRNNVGMNNLKYGAAYHPWIQTVYDKTFTFRDINNNLSKGGVTTTFKALVKDTDVDENGTKIKDRLIGVESLITDNDNIASSFDTFITAQAAGDTISDIFNNKYTTYINTPGTVANLKGVFNFIWDLLVQVDGLLVDNSANADTLLITNSDFLASAQSFVTSNVVASMQDLIDLDNEALRTIHDLFDSVNTYSGYSAKFLSTQLGSMVISAVAPNFITGTTDSDKISQCASKLKEIYTVVANAITSLTEMGIAYESTQADTVVNYITFYKSILSSLGSKSTLVPPSGAIAGIISAVDSTRGVWKAPANVSINSINSVSEFIDDAIQENLNIDPNAGKSINAIRSFTGKGIIVWGARTLAGNDSEWRYVPVRRFFNFVEESCKKSTSWAVFEPNDANLWAKVRGMIDNFLNNLWRRGALAGAKPEHAYYINVGLGYTMTAQDILDGKLIIEIGLAAVRPAEFIILRFSHKLQQS